MQKTASSFCQVEDLGKLFLWFFFGLFGIFFVYFFFFYIRDYEEQLQVLVNVLN